MTIRYRNGSTYDAVLLSRSEQLIRVAVAGSEDIVELTLANGTWVTDHCEPVEIDFAWTRQKPVVETKIEDCICSHELAAQLIHSLVAGDDEPEMSPIERVMSAPVYHQVV